MITPNLKVIYLYVYQYVTLSLNSYQVRISKAPQTQNQSDIVKLILIPSAKNADNIVFHMKPFRPGPGYSRCSEPHSTFK